MICNPLSGFSLKYGSAEQPWAIGEGMLGLDLAALGGQAQCFGADAEERRGFGQVHPSVRVGNLRAVNWDLVV
jgi:hypothetical protein